MQSFTVTRTFHPVGQGAFYSERINAYGRSFLIVYDCGATNANTPPKSLCKEVFEAFHEDRYDERGRLMVDVLFISHFHNDHLNGIPLLAPEKVICPYVSDEDILIFQVLNHFSPEWNVEAMRNPGILFDNDTRIIRVAPTDEEQMYDENNRILNLNDLSSEIPSGTRIGVRPAWMNCLYEWCFIPFNFHYKEREREFKRLLSDGIPGNFEGGLEFEDLEKDPADFINKNRKPLRQICDIFSGKTNDQSLLLYSGPTGESLEMEYVGSSLGYYQELIRHIQQHWYYEPEIIRWISHHTDMSQFRHVLSLNLSQRKEHPAAIYYGDITLRGRLVRSLTRRLKDYMKFVGTIQLPHHGSDRSFDESVMSDHSNWTEHPYPDNTVLFVMSAGSKSKTHPGKTVVSMLSKSRQAYLVVKENRSSGYAESWSLHHDKK